LLVFLFLECSALKEFFNSEKSTKKENQKVEEKKE
jgi:hypothetical protein